MNQPFAAFYARVSSEQQAEAHTIQRQVAALRARVAAAGCPWPPEREVIDEGDRGSTLVRPGLERLRDVAAPERRDVPSPARLARRYA